MALSHQGNMLAYHIYHLDSYSRYELSIGSIISEDDYTSNFCSRIRNSPFLQSSGICNIVTYSRKLNRQEEQTFGCDAVIIISFQNNIKIGLFEAKWPRVSLPKYKWDYITNGTSHFSSQLNRQQQWSNSCAIWEMFYHEIPPGQRVTPFDKMGSTCVWHDVAYSFDSTRNSSNIWTNYDLKNMLISRPSFYLNSNFSMNIRHIILKMLLCIKGERFDIPENDEIALIGKEKEINIPIPSAGKNSKKINEFMKMNGLSQYLYLDLKQQKLGDTKFLRNFKH